VCAIRPFLQRRVAYQQPVTSLFANATLVVSQLAMHAQHSKQRAAPALHAAPNSARGPAPASAAVPALAHTNGGPGALVAAGDATGVASARRHNGALSSARKHSIDAQEQSDAKNQPASPLSAEAKVSPAGGSSGGAAGTLVLSARRPSSGTGAGSSSARQHKRTSSASRSRRGSGTGSGHGIVDGDRLVLPKQSLAAIEDSPHLTNLRELASLSRKDTAGDLTMQARGSGAGSDGGQEEPAQPLPGQLDASS
jgi:hypothetical protein